MRILLCWVIAGMASIAHADNSKVDLIVVEKAKRTLTLMRNGSAFKTYKVALGTEPIGAKRMQGDHKTPEGEYVIDSRNPKSSYHLGLHVSYPSASDRVHAKRTGVDPGGAIMIHGLPNGSRTVGAAHRLRDWTDGCIAVTDEEIEEIWRLVPNGTKIVIRP